MDGALEMISTRSGTWKTPTAVIASVALIIAFVVVVIVKGGIPGRSYAWAGCGEGPTNPTVTAEQYSDAFQYPYGDVTSCRELRRQSPLFGSTDLSVYVLLTTQKGLVAVRVDYDGLGERRYTANATELAANDVPSGLSADETARLQADISARGGVRPGPWILHYGDG